MDRATHRMPAQSQHGSGDEHSEEADVMVQYGHGDEHSEEADVMLTDEQEPV